LNVSDPDKPEQIPSDEELIAALTASQRKNRTVWTVVFVACVLFVVTSIWLAAENRELLFAPKPDMTEVERLAFEGSNDPACRQLVDTLDGRQKVWTQQRAGLKDLYTSTDRAAIVAGRMELQVLIETYKQEQRRLEIAVIQDRDTETFEGRRHKTDLRADIQRYFKHVLHYLGKMEGLLGERLAELDGGGARVDVPGLGEVKVVSGTGASPLERYQTAWSRVTEDHDKWRIFRQGPSPCGRREGAVPELPPEGSGSAMGDLKRQFGMVDEADGESSAPDAGSAADGGVEAAPAAGADAGVDAAAGAGDAAGDAAP